MTNEYLGATGGRSGINNETTLGGGLFRELVNVSAGVSLAAYSLPLCGTLIVANEGRRVEALESG
jgi:hypothetical protein